jgi:hypothetical protein
VVAGGLFLASAPIAIKSMTARNMEAFIVIVVVLERMGLISREELYE